MPLGRCDEGASFLDACRRFRPQTLAFSILALLFAVILARLAFFHIARDDVAVSEGMSLDGRIIRKLEERIEGKSFSDQSYYIALNLFNNEEILPLLSEQLILLSHVVGVDNVFISIYENGKWNMMELCCSGEEVVERSCATGWDTGNSVVSLVSLRSPLLRLLAVSFWPRKSTTTPTISLPQICSSMVPCAGSRDGTKSLLVSLRRSLEDHKIRHSIVSSNDNWRNFCDRIVDPSDRSACETSICTTLRDCGMNIRIPVMAAIRNMALLPLLGVESAREAALQTQHRQSTEAQYKSAARTKAVMGSEADDEDFEQLQRRPQQQQQQHHDVEGDPTFSDRRDSRGEGQKKQLPFSPSPANSIGEGAHLGLTKPVLVLFLNDIVAFAEDLLELIATEDGRYDMACAMDFELLKFYDTWVARDMSGNAFSSWYPYIREATAQERLRQGKPFRVFSCWNGAVAVRASFLVHDGIIFRSWGINEPRSLHPNAEKKEVSGVILGNGMAWRDCLVGGESRRRGKALHAKRPLQF